MGNWITTAEAKTLLQISASTYDTLIAALRPIIRQDLHDYCQNRFLNGNVYLTASTFSYTAKAGETAAYISDSDSNFIDSYFASNMDIYVWGSLVNDGPYETGTIAAAKISLATTEDLTAEAAALATATIQQVIYPDSLKIWAARMISYQLNKSVQSGITSRSLGDFSETFGNLSGGYPDSILKGLTKWRCTRAR